MIGLGRRKEALKTFSEMLDQRVPGDEVEFFRYELLRASPDPPDGIDEMMSLLKHASHGGDETVSAQPLRRI